MLKSGNNAWQLIEMFQTFNYMKILGRIFHILILFIDPIIDWEVQLNSNIT